MIHGCQKQMLHVRSTDSKLFEEAFVVLRPGAGDLGSVSTRDEMIREAEAVVREAVSRLCPSAVRKRALGKATVFFMGFAAGTLSVIVLLCLFHAI